MKRLFLLLSALLGGLALAADRRSIVIILTDDADYSDLGCYGSEIQPDPDNAGAAKGPRKLPQ